MSVFTNIAAYQFAALSDLKPLRERLLALCRSWSLKGTILLSPEGVNLFVAGGAAEIELLLAELRAIPGLETLTPKYSESATQPFSRMLVRLKKEIIAFGVEGIDPVHRPSPKLAPRELKAWLDEGRPVTLLDTRNDYEVKLGTFRGARTLDLKHFRDFPKAVKGLPPEWKDQPIVMFCTGGIRCEKAGPFMEREGFQKIYQLDGGILKYFEDCGGAHYDGECFVFDQRTGLDPTLNESHAALCFHCLTPLTEEEQQDARYVQGVSCPYCFKTTEEERAENLQKRNDALRRATTPLPGAGPYDMFRPVSVPPEAEGLPLLEFLGSVLSHVPREEWIEAIEQKRLLNSEKKPVTATHPVHTGERYLHWYPNTHEPDVNPAVEISHEDEAILVINKPAPLPLHPGGRFNRNTLQHFLNTVYHPQHPRPAHRLDANTTGVLVCARTRHFAGLLQPQFARGEVEKIYLVRVQGHPLEETFSCDAPITDEPGESGSREIDFDHGLPARTEFRVLQRCNDGTSLLEARPLTGRTNQIRLHTQALGFPVCGDPLYGPTRTTGGAATLHPNDPPLCLHAWQIEFTHPLTRQRVRFEARRPDWA